MKINNKYMGVGVTALALVGVLAAPLAFADTPKATVSTVGNVNAMNRGEGMKVGLRNRMGMRPGVFGTVASVSGNTITVTGKSGMPNTTTTTPITYTIDATNAKVMKANVASTVSAIAVGDTVSIMGTVSGTNVTATQIFDGVMKKPEGTPKQPITYPITGNGQPVIAGTISSINGSSIVVTNKSNVTYAVDATNAKIVQGQTVVAIGSVKVGDNVLVQGTVNGTTVTASSIIDEAQTGTTTTGTSPKPRGFFGGIGHFISSIFGF